MRESERTSSSEQVSEKRKKVMVEWMDGKNRMYEKKIVKALFSILTWAIFLN